MAEEGILAGAIYMASRIDSLHQELSAAREQLEAWRRKCGRLQKGLDDACAQRDEYQERIMQLERLDDTGRLVCTASFLDAAKSVVSELNTAIDKSGQANDDSVMLSLSRALAHAESVRDVLCHGGEK